MHGALWIRCQSEFGHFLGGATEIDDAGDRHPNTTNTFDVWLDIVDLCGGDFFDAFNAVF